MKFEWDENKAASNIKIHDGVSFADGAETLFDEFAVEEYDINHSEMTEQRFNRVGLSKKGVLFVVYTVRGDEENEIIRIISVRYADNFEKGSYWTERKHYE